MGLMEGLGNEAEPKPSRDELITQLAGLHASGLDQVMILPNFDTRYDVLERVGRDLVGHIN